MKRFQHAHAVAVAVIIFLFQCIATCSIWDLKVGVLLSSLMAVLCVIQFPTFIIILSLLFLPSLSSSNIFVYLSEKAFSIYLSKFYVFAIAHSILWYHILTGAHDGLSKSSLYILFLYGLLLFLSLLPDSPVICLLLFPLDVLVPFGLYRLVDHVLSRMIGDRCRGQGPPHVPTSDIGRQTSRLATC